jgi:hypothetical protein
MPSAGEAGVAPDGLPISPELILVSSPEEQLRARELLPPNPAEEWDRLLATIRARAALEPVEPSPAPRARKPRRALVLASLLLVAVAVPIGMAGARDDLGGRHVSAHASRNVHRATSPAVQHPGAPSTPVTRPNVKKPAAKSKHPAKRSGKRATKPKPKAPAPNTKPKTSRPSAPQVSGFVPSRVWGWVAQPGSVSYLFRLYRNGRQVYKARTRQAQLVLPDSFRFAAGKYRWSVVAIGSSKKRGLKPVVESTFVLSGAAAAKANS